MLKIKYNIFTTNSYLRYVHEQTLTKRRIANYIFMMLVWFVVNLFFSCSRQTQQEGLLIAVSIPPQAWFVSQIAGDNAKTIVLAGPGQNPHNYEPTPKQIQSLVSAGAWILSGTEFEISLLPKITSLFPGLLIVDGTEGVKFRLLEDRENVGDRGEYSSMEIDRHTWLGREPAKILASHIRDTLCILDTENEAYYHAQCEELIRLIDKEFDELKVILEPLRGRSVFVYHPSFGYFLDEFEINQEAVETGGKDPGPRVLNDLVIKLREEQASAIFVQAQFPVNTVRTLAAAVGAQVISLDPLEQDWLENIRSMGQAFKRAIP